MDKRTNTVRLDGMLESCRHIKSDSRNSYYALSVLTLHPQVKDGAEGRTEFIRHPVRAVVQSGGVTDRRLKDMEGIIREELDKGSGPAKPRPVKVDGILVMGGDRSYVAVQNEGLSFPDKISFVNNNRVDVTGKVKDVSHTSDMATLVVSTATGDITAAWPKQFNQSGWKAVSEGKVRKGDEVSLTGNLLYFTGEEKKSSMLILSPTKIRKAAVQKKVLHTPGL